MTLTPSRALRVGLVCAVLSVLTATAAARADSPLGTDAAGERATVELLSQRLTVARARHEWDRFAALAYGDLATGEQLARLARLAGQDETDPADPTVEAFVTDSARTPYGAAVVTVRATGRTVHTWVLTWQPTDAGWHLVGETRDPGGDPLPTD